MQMLPSYATYITYTGQNNYTIRNLSRQIDLKMPVFSAKLYFRQPYFQKKAYFSKT